MAHDAPHALDERVSPSPQIAGSHLVEHYETWETVPLPDPRGMPPHKIVDRLVEIIEIEGPVVLERVFHLFAGAAGIRRVGNQLRDLFLRASEIAISSGRIEEEHGQRKLRLKSVVRSAGSQTVVPRNRGPRDFDEIPQSEVAQVMQSILKMHPTTRREKLYRRVLDFYELKRLTSNVRESLDRIVSEKELVIAEPDTLGSEGPIRNSNTQSRSKYQFELLGEHFAVDTLADVLVRVIFEIEKKHKWFLSRLSKESGRVRPIVARNPRDLYPGRPDLSHYSREIADGWFVGTNYSKRDVARILRLACTVGGLVYGQDLRGSAIDEMEDRLS